VVQVEIDGVQEAITIYKLYVIRNDPYKE